MALRWLSPGVKLCAKAVTGQKRQNYTSEEEERGDREEGGGRGEQGGGIQWNRGMSNVFQQQTSYSVYIHCCTSSIQVAKGADHVPVSHHAAVAALSTASHYHY